MYKTKYSGSKEIAGNKVVKESEKIINKLIPSKVFLGRKIQSNNGFERKENVTKKLRIEI